MLWKKEWREEVFIQISESQIGRAIRTKKWKYSVRAPLNYGILKPNSKFYYEDFLYDLENDPYELTNLVKDKKYKDVRKSLSKVLINYIEEIEGYIPLIYPNSKKIKLTFRSLFNKFFNCLEKKEKNKKSHKLHNFTNFR
ncbi:MAG: hypothetical protein ACTSRZ_15185 [Promethearchaeota archaeon]